jgi:hypothetical protein
MKQLEHPETHLKTDTRPHADTVYSGTSWGHAGRDAILARLKRADELEAMAMEMIRAVPGGQFCDPQEVADTLREIAERHGVKVK